MKLTATLMLLLIATGALHAQSKSTTIQDLGWLTGCWEGEKQAGQFEECWTAPRGNEMMGSSRITSSNGTTVFREFMLIEQLPDGILLTVQHIGSRLKPDSKPVSFKLVEASAKEAVFENPQHDHPQRIAYTRSPGGNINCRISLLDGSKASDWPMNQPPPQKITPPSATTN